MSARLERLLLVATPAVAMATVALGLRVGAGSAVRAAVVHGAPASGAGTGLAWQVVVFDEDHGFREPVPGVSLEVLARAGDREARWQGATSDDGAAEVLLPFADAATPAATSSATAASATAPAATTAMHMEVRAGRSLLAVGDAAPAPEGAREPPASSWARFARREGDVVLDVAVLGQRVATGFPVHLWVRATDAASHAPLAGVTVEAERDASFLPAATQVTTDARGWAHVVATPVGHAVAVVLHASSPSERTGVWAGGLYVSPGAAQLSLPERVAPGRAFPIEVVMPTVRSTAYLEIDDAQGRAWAAAARVTGPAGEMPRATVEVPPLAPGLYWAVEAGDPVGASELGPGSVAQPFFVAASDAEALALGTDRETCAATGDARGAARALGPCLALAGATPVPRWTALDGVALQHGRDAEKRGRGLAIALAAILLAVLLEALLLLKTSAAARAKLRAASDDLEDGSRRLLGRGWTAGAAVLVALLGFALMAAFLARVG